VLAVSARRKDKDMKTKIARIYPVLVFLILIISVFSYGMLTDTVGDRGFKVTLALVFSISVVVLHWLLSAMMIPLWKFSSETKAQILSDVHFGNRTSVFLVRIGYLFLFTSVFVYAVIEPLIVMNDFIILCVALISVGFVLKVYHFINVLMSLCSGRAEVKSIS
jgi:flagellar biogenesis protein FliO